MKYLSCAKMDMKININIIDHQDQGIVAIDLVLFLMCSGHFIYYS